MMGQQAWEACKGRGEGGVGDLVAYAGREFTIGMRFTALFL
jgi:hypothetical protein